MQRNLYCVIMAGGGGNNFWPVTREDHPQHVLRGRTIHKESFLRGTFSRFAEFVPKENIFVVTLSRFALLVHEEIPELPHANIIEEPIGRKTAPCIALAACKIRERDPEAIMIATPCDHIISEGPEFAASILKAVEHVNAEPVLMTIGIIPTAPKTDYGYIQVQGGRQARNTTEPIPVKTFTEKPDAEVAEAFFSSGEFFWNSGIFVWRNETILAELSRYVPVLGNMIDGWPEVAGTENEEPFLARMYADCEKVSVDYAVMEKTDKAWLCPAQFGWDDIGDWDAVYRNVPERDGAGNAANTEHTYVRDAQGNLLVTDNSEKLIAVCGLKDYMVVDTTDALLICPRDDKRYRDFISGIALPGYEDYR